jgi:hypothetical protein
VHTEEGPATSRPFFYLVLLPRAVVVGGCLVQDSSQLSLLRFCERWGSRGLRLEERTKKNAIVELGTGRTQISIEQLLANPLSLEDLGFAFTASMA